MLLALILHALISDSKSSFTNQNVNTPIVSCPANSKHTELTEEDMENAANQLGIEKCSMKSIIAVESKGKGFLKDGTPKILFEPHKMWRNLKDEDYTEEELKNIQNDGYSKVLYKKWGQEKYGSELDQWNRLNKASEIDSDSAIKSASWGKFQVLGENYKEAGFNSPSEMMNAMCDSETEHLRLFKAFIKKNNLIQPLREKNWEKFAKKYNGPGYKKNKYDEKLSENYDSCKEKEESKKNKLP